MLIEWIERRPPKKKYPLWIAIGFLVLTCATSFLIQGRSFAITTRGVVTGSDLEDRVKELEKDRDNLKATLEREYVRLKDLPLQFQSQTPASVVSTINDLSSKLQLLESDIANSVNLVGNIITQQVSINLRAGGTVDTRSILINREIQRVMQVLGYYDGQLSGDREATRGAIESFQRINGLKVDGQVGKNTWTKARDLIEQERGRDP
jgi:hypothetical protein